VGLSYTKMNANLVHDQVYFGKHFHLNRWCIDVSLFASFHNQLWITSFGKNGNQHSSVVNVHMPIPTQKAMST